MEPFSITCTTCQAKLKVRDASAIGQILTCPKCGSMLLVEAPPNFSAEPDASHAGRAEHPPSPATPEGLPPRPPVRTASGGSNEPQVFHDLSDTVEDLTRYGTSKPPLPSADRITDPLADATAAREQGESVGHPLPPAAPPESDRVAAHGLPAELKSDRRRLLLTLMAGSAGVLMAIILFAVLSRPKTTTSPPVTKGPPKDPLVDSTKNNPTAPPATAKANETHPGTKAGPSEKASEKAPDKATNNPPEASRDQPAPGNGATSDSVSPPATAGNTEPPKASTTPDSTPQKPATAQASPDGAPAKAPSDFANPMGPNEQADRVAGAGSLSETLRRLGGLVDDAAPKEDEPKPNDPATAHAADVSKEPKPEAAPLPRPEPRNTDVAARLNDPMLEIEFTGVSLYEFLRHMTAQSTIPITLDADMLMWSRLTPATSVSVHLTDTTVGKVLEQVLGSQGLMYVAADRHLWVTRKSANGNAMRVVPLDVKDLAGEDSAKLAELRALIVAAVEPDTWEQDGRHGGSIQLSGTVLQVEQTESVLLGVMAFCEKLRVVRGLPTRGKFDPRHFQLASRTERAKPQLAKQVTLNYPIRTSFDRIVQRLSKESGANLLINWRTLALAGWNPEGETTLTVSNQTLADALDKLLTPMELAYRIIDEKTFEITTPAAIEERQEIEFYSVKKLMGENRSLEVLMKQLVEKVPQGWFREAGGAGVVQFDAPSSCLLVSLSQTQHRAFEAALNQLEAEPSK